MKQKRSRRQLTATLLTITSLPKALIEKILQHVSMNSFTDLFNAKKVCKLFLENSERNSIYKAVELSRFRQPTAILTEAQKRFVDKCYVEKNPEAIYNKGVQYYFLHNKTTEGLHLLKCAADGGYNRAVYVYALLQRTLGEVKESQTYIMHLPRYCVRSIRNQFMTEADGGWAELLPTDFVNGRDAFDLSEAALECYSWVIKESWNPKKYDDCLCDDCFWHVEHILFLRHFPEHISFWIDH